MQRRTALFVPFLLASGLAAKAGARAAYRGPVFQEVATSEYQWNSTAVSRTGRVFTSFPTRNEFPSFHVGELRGGVTVSFLPRDVNESLVNVSNIFIDDADRLWILDSGKLAGRPVNKSAARLICVNITHRMVLQTFRIPSELLESNSTLANVRVDSQQNIAFISDGGAGGLIVLDLESGKGWLGLDRSVQQTRANAKFLALPTGNYYPIMPNIAALALSEDRRTLYFTPLIETKIYSIPTHILRDRSLRSHDRARYIMTEARDAFPSAGMVERSGVLYFGDVRHDRVASLHLMTHRVSEMKTPTPIRWADGFSLDSRGNIWLPEVQADDVGMTRPVIPKKRLTFTAAVCGIMRTYVVPFTKFVSCCSSMPPNSMTPSRLPQQEPKATPIRPEESTGSLMRPADSSANSEDRTASFETRPIERVFFLV